MSSTIDRPTANIRVFAPEQWGEVTKFRMFAHSTYQLKPRENMALHGVEGHFQKYSVLLGLAQRLAPALIEDNEEVDKQGYSSAIRSKELAAIVDALFSELYSAVDCTRQVIAAIYGKYKGVTAKSTSKLFKNASEGKLDEKVPKEIRVALAEANWFPKLRDIRTAITHYNIGSCHMDKDGRISYFLHQFGTQTNTLVTEDVIQEVSTYANQINKLLGRIYRTLNNTLKDVETVQICGIFGGRIYQRFVSSQEARDFNSGRCKSYEWFEKDTEPTCPFTKDCGAYVRSLALKEKVSRT
jgi:nucleoid DNA-binding protein